MGASLGGCSAKNSGPGGSAQIVVKELDGDTVAMVEAPLKSTVVELKRSIAAQAPQLQCRGVLMGLGPRGPG